MTAGAVTATLKANKANRPVPPVSKTNKSGSTSHDKVPYDKLSSAQIGALDGFGVQPDVLRKVSTPKKHNTNVYTSMALDFLMKGMLCNCT